MNKTNIKVVTMCREILINTKVHNFPVAEFIHEQNKALECLGVEYDYFLIKSGGYKNYIKQAHEFRLYLKKSDYRYDIIHAHGGHVGAIANSQRKIPVITTYHGSDINNRLTRLISIFALSSSSENIFVSSNMLKQLRTFFTGYVIPCGIDMNTFQALDKNSCRNKLGFSENEKIILFAGDPLKKVKNYKLAIQSTKLIKNKHQLIELKGYNRKIVNLLLNAADLLLLTSFSEGSPQIIKEAMACNCPIVATDVGDIKEVVGTTEGCHLTSFDSREIAEKIELALKYEKRTSGRDKIKHLDNMLIAKRIYEIYCDTINKN